MKRCYYSDSIQTFLETSENVILGELVLEHDVPIHDDDINPLSHSRNRILEVNIPDSTL